MGYVGYALEHVEASSAAAFCVGKQPGTGETLGQVHVPAVDWRTIGYGGLVSLIHLCTASWWPVDG